MSSLFFLEVFASIPWKEIKENIMTEYNAENDRQDPADQYRTENAVETEPQPDNNPDAVEATPVEPTVTETSTEESQTTTRISGQEYTVDPNKGYRVVAGEPAPESDTPVQDSSDES